GLEERGDAVRLTPARRGVNHRAHEKSHHVVQEAVRFDLEDETALALAPPGAEHRTAMMVVGARCAPDGKGTKAAVARKGDRVGFEHRTIERARQRPLPAPSEGRTRCLVGTDVIAVAPR